MDQSTCVCSSRSPHTSGSGLSLGGPLASLFRMVFYCICFCCPFPGFSAGSEGAFCTVVALSMLRLCCSLGDLRPLHGVLGSQFFVWRFDNLISLLAIASTISLKIWAEAMQSDPLCDCEKHIKDYCTPTAYPVDCPHGLEGPKLSRLSRVIEFLSSPLTLVCVLLFRPLLEDSTVLKSPRLLFW